MSLLRSLGSSCHLFYKYAAPTALPRLHAAPSDAEKATLQNAFTDTDHQIGQLVYELYVLTP
jgi:hypothetical protein